MRKLRISAALAAGAMGLMAPGLASAHFTLNSPMSWAQQGSLGVPEKSAPCGQADPGTTPVPTNVVTTYRPGQKITVSITEDVFHQGFYRADIVAKRDERSSRLIPWSTPGVNGCRPTGVRAGHPPPARRRLSGLTPQAAFGRPPRGRGSHAQSGTPLTPGHPVLRRHAAQQRNVHELRSSDRRVHVQPSAQQSRRVLLSPLREHRDPGYPSRWWDERWQ